VIATHKGRDKRTGQRTDHRRQVFHTASAVEPGRLRRRERRRLAPRPGPRSYTSKTGIPAPQAIGPHGVTASTPHPDGIQSTSRHRHAERSTTTFAEALVRRDGETSAHLGTLGPHRRAQRRSVRWPTESTSSRRPRTRQNALRATRYETADATLVGQIVGALVAHDEPEHERSTDSIVGSTKPTS